MLMGLSRHGSVLERCQQYNHTGLHSPKATGLRLATVATQAAASYCQPTNPFFELQTAIMTTARAANQPLYTLSHRTWSLC